MLRLVGAVRKDAGAGGVVGGRLLAEDDAPGPAPLLFGNRSARVHNGALGYI
jgi:hypothetical protein